MVKYHVPHPGSPVEELKVAFCLTGASRSLPTVPVLRGFKKNVLQSRRYVAAAFAALSLSPNVPGIHDSNLTLANKLSNVLYVRRAMQRLQPELKSWVTINSSEVIAQYGQRSCPAGGGLQPTTHTTPVTTMWLTSLYAMQRCYSLVRGYELGRFDKFAFDYVVRLRPDQLYHKPFPLAINVSVADWPDDRVLKPAGQEGVALMPQGPVAAVYFRTFTSAGSCTLIAPSTPSLGQATLTLTLAPTPTLTLAPTPTPTPTAIARAGGRSARRAPAHQHGALRPHTAVLAARARGAARPLPNWGHPSPAPHATSTARPVLVVPAGLDAAEA